MLGTVLLAIGFSSSFQLQDVSIGGLDRATVERVIAGAVEGRFPYVITQTSSGVSFTVTTPYTKIASASVAADMRGIDFTLEEVTSEMRTFDIGVDPPAKSSDEEIEAYEKYEADHENHGPLSHCVTTPIYFDIANVVDATLIGPDGSDWGGESLSLTERAPFDLQLAKSGHPPGDSAGRYGTGLNVTLPLEALLGGTRLRVFLSNGRQSDLALDREWLEMDRRRFEEEARR